MLIADFNSYRLALLDLYSNKVSLMCNKIRIDKDWKNDLFLLKTAKGYIEIMMEYTPIVEGASDSNFFTVPQMQDIQERLNSLFVTDYNVIDYLTT